jgi:hypothetical protein
VHWHESIPSVDVPRLDALQLWLVAVLCFGVGDVVTTSIGLGLAGVVEAHPVAGSLFQYPPLGVMVALKSVVFGVCYALWAWTPRPHCLGVPLGLALVGVLVTAWNLHVLFHVLLP